MRGFVGRKCPAELDDIAVGGLRPRNNCRKSAENGHYDTMTKTATVVNSWKCFWLACQGGGVPDRGRRTQPPSK